MLCESAEATDTGKLFILGVAGIWRVKARKAKTIAQLMARPWPDGPVGQFHAETVQDPGELPRSKEDQTLLLRRSAPSLHLWKLKAVHWHAGRLSSLRPQGLSWVILCTLLPHLKF